MVHSVAATIMDIVKVFLANELMGNLKAVAVAESLFFVEVWWAYQVIQMVVVATIWNMLRLISMVNFLDGL